MALQDGDPTWTLRQLSAGDADLLGVADSVGVVFQYLDGSGKWTDRGAINTADAPWRFAVRGFRKAGRIVFFGSYNARQAWALVANGRSDAVASLLSARHSRLGSLEGTFVKDGGTSIDLSVGDTLVLTYRMEHADASAAPDWFLLVGPPGSETSTPTF